MWIKREIEDSLVRLSRKKPAIMVTGPRQTGKTSLLKHLFPQHQYVALDLPLIAEEAESSGQTFLSKHPSPLIIDEVQYAPGLFRYLKQVIDQNREACGQYCITGSQQFSLMQGVTESLAGRITILDCHPLSLRELEKWSGKTAQGIQLLEWIFKGGYPELHAQDLDPERFYADYVSTYLERDIRQVIQVKNLRDFDRFMRLAAVRTGQTLSLSSFSTDLGITPNTVKSWLAVLEASNTIMLLEPYYRNLGKRIVKTPKLYFLDTGLACFLAGLRSVADLENSNLLGALFETHVLTQMVRSYANQGKKLSLYFYRDHMGHEVDFVIPMGEKLKLIECKFNERPTYPTKGFKEVNALIGENKIISQTIITPVRGQHQTSDKRITIADSVEFAFI